MSLKFNKATTIEHEENEIETIEKINEREQIEIAKINEKKFNQSEKRRNVRDQRDEFRIRSGSQVGSDYPCLPASLSVGMRIAWCTLHDATASHTHGE